MIAIIDSLQICKKKHAVGRSDSVNSRGSQQNQLLNSTSKPGSKQAYRHLEMIELSQLRSLTIFNENSMLTIF